MLEYFCLSNIEDTFAYNVLQDTMATWNFRIEKTAMIGITLIQIMVVVSQSRIEYDTYRHGDLDSGIVIKVKNWLLKSYEVNPDGLDQSIYSVSATRLVFLRGAIWGIVGLSLPLYQIGNEKLFLLFGAFVSEVLLPFAFIWTHQDL